MRLLYASNKSPDKTFVATCAYPLRDRWALVNSNDADPPHRAFVSSLSGNMRKTLPQAASVVSRLRIYLQLINKGRQASI